MTQALKRLSTLLLIALLVVSMSIVAGCGNTEESNGSTMDGTADDGGTTQQDGQTTDDDGEGLPQAVPGDYTDLTPEQAKQLIDTTPDLVIVDVSPAYADGHLPGAVNYYIGDGSLEAALPSLDMSVPYLVYCHVDSASIGGAELMVAAGFSEVYRLQGNYSAWVAAGYPVEK